jgi:hypothetical protein
MTVAGAADAASQAAGSDWTQLAGARAQGLPGCLDRRRLQVLLVSPSACSLQPALMERLLYDSVDAQSDLASAVTTAMAQSCVNIVKLQWGFAVTRKAECERRPAESVC